VKIIAITFKAFLDTSPVANHFSKFGEVQHEYPANYNCEWWLSFFIWWLWICYSVPLRGARANGDTRAGRRWKECFDRSSES